MKWFTARWLVSDKTGDTRQKHASTFFSLIYQFVDDQWSPQLSQEISTLLTVLSVRILHLSDHLTKQSHVLGRLRLYLSRCNCDAGVHCHSMQRQIKNHLCDDVCCEQRSLKGHTKSSQTCMWLRAIVSGQKFPWIVLLYQLWCWDRQIPARGELETWDCIQISCLANRIIGRTKERKQHMPAWPCLSFVTKS